MRLVAMILGVVAGTAVSPVVVSGQQPETMISKDAISVHTVKRGIMNLRETASGVVVALSPARALITLTPEQRPLVRAGQTCSVQVVAPEVHRCRVVRVSSDTAELAVTTRLPSNIAINDRLGALIDVGTTDTVVYFERPRSARPNTTSTIFVIEADGVHAKRVRVVYGRLSGAEMEIISGLAAGDRVIVTDLPSAEGRDRIALK